MELGTGPFWDSNEAILLGADASARVSDIELQVVMAENQRAVLAALVFSLCEQAEKLNPYIADIIDEQGYPMTNRGHVVEPILRGNGMHLRPNGRNFLVVDDVYDWRAGLVPLFGRPIDAHDERGGVSMQLTNDHADALNGFRQATDEEVTEIRGYTRRLFAEVMNDVDLTAETEAFRTEFHID